MIEDLTNPVGIIEFILNIAKGFIDFMETDIWIPFVGTASVWHFFAGALIPLLLFILGKRFLL